MLEKEFESEIVEGIQLGLKNAKIAKRENGDKFDNSEAFRKVDKIMSSLYGKIEENGCFEAKIFSRGGYKLLFAYNKENHTLISFMSENRLYQLINSDKVEDKQNYIFGLMKFNPAARQQQTLFQGMDWVIDENEKIKDRVREIIEEDGNIEYITVLYNIQGYRLLKVNEVKLSQYAEIIEDRDLSDYIKVDYEDIYEDENMVKEEIFGELEFNLKNDILAKSDNLDMDLDNKEEKEENNNE